MKIPFKIPGVRKIAKVASRIKVPSRISRFAGNIALKTKNHSPEICLVSGIIVGGFAFVKIGINTWRNKELIQEDANAVKALCSPDDSELSEDDRKKALCQARFTFYKDVAKTYCVPFFLFVASTGFFVYGHGQLRKHLSAALATNAMLMETLNKYRQKVIDEYGAEKDQEFMYGIKMLKAVDNETGEEYVKSDISEDYGCSMYARWWDEGEFDSSISAWKWRNPNYRSNKLDNLTMLKVIENAANDRLNVRGWIKLNEVYTMLGLPCTPEGEYVGWVKGSGHDDFIDFGVFPDHLKGRRQLPVNKLFVDEYNPQNQALLDFNVDGDITYIFKDIYEYDNRSAIACSKRRR